jgi:hypothetical protein
MSNLPEAVRKQVERAEALQKQELDRVNGDTEPAATEETPQEQEPEQQQPHEEPTEPHQERDEWKERYNTLQGKYNAEVPRLQHELRQMRDQMGQLNQQLQEAQTQKETPEQSDLNPDAYSEYGEEFERMARVIQAQSAELDRLKGDMGQVVQGQQQSRQDQFWTALKGAMPDWETQNNDPAFHQWLGQTIPGTRTTYQAVLDQAGQAFDVGRVVEVFNAWPGKQKPAAKPRPSVSTQQAPTSTGAGATGNVAPQQTYTGHEIKYLFTEGTKNQFPIQFRGKLIEREEAERIKRDMSIAINEGRVV